MLGNKQLTKLMETPMSRKEFLRYMGIALLSAVGVGNVISSLLHNTAKPQQKELKGRGFGGGKYGI